MLFSSLKLLFDLLEYITYVYAMRIILGNRANTPFYFVPWVSVFLHTLCIWKKYLVRYSPQQF